MHEIKYLALFLTLLGGVPFVFSAIAIATQFGSEERMLYLLIPYAGLILTFVGGIHWGAILHNAYENTRFTALIILEAVMLMLTSWLVPFIDGVHFQVLAFAFLYSLSWGVDSILHAEQYTPLWYFEVRCVITPILVVCLYVIYFNII